MGSTRACFILRQSHTPSPISKFEILHQFSEMSVNKQIRKVTTNTLLKLKINGEKISMITAYDFSFAKLFDAAGIDVILVGDSASNVMAGHESTLPITLDQMIYHAASVIRGTERALVVVDLPFGSYQSNSDVALASAIRIMKETGAHALKLEGGEEVVDSIKRIVSAGIPVMGHLGLTPQSIHKFGTYVVRAKDEAEANKLRTDALLLQQAGCFAVVLEKIPAALAKEVTESLIMPTIGIGAGMHCSGQVLVMHDLLGINTEFKPRFLRSYLNMAEQVTGAVKQYIDDVKSGDFPNEKEQY
jgi:3-methyl-2-oxobutanoate hydroxymethyltransferase